MPGGARHVIRRSAPRPAASGHGAVADQRVPVQCADDLVMAPAGGIGRCVIVADDQVRSARAADAVAAGLVLRPPGGVGVIADDQVFAAAALDPAPPGPAADEVAVAAPL